MNSICIIHIPHPVQQPFPDFYFSGFPISFQCDRLHKLKSFLARHGKSDNHRTVSPHGRLQKQIRRNYIQIVLLIGRQCEEPDSRNCFFVLNPAHPFFLFLFCSIPDVQIFIPVYHIFPEPVAEPSINLLSSVPDTPDRPFTESAVHWKTSADDMLRDTCNSPNPQSILLSVDGCSSRMRPSDTSAPLFPRCPPEC